MRGILRALTVVTCLLLILPSNSSAKVRMRGWYFPKPFTMNSPMSPPRFGGMELGFGFADAGTGIAFPLQSSMTFGKKVPLTTDLALPFAIGAAKSGGAKFWLGNFRISLLGNWRFMVPFAGGHKFPAALSVGADIGLPLAAIWGGNTAWLLTFPMFIHDYAAWLPKDFSIRPRINFGMGKPVFFLLAELGVPGIDLNFGGHHTLLLNWGLALGSQPHNVISMTLEFGGIHDLINHNLMTNHYWGALGARFYIGKFVTGLVLRVPFNDLYPEVAGENSFNVKFSFNIFVGYEMRQRKAF